jgi:hypothetical protein
MHAFPSAMFLHCDSPPYEPARLPPWKISVHQAYFSIQGLSQPRNQEIMAPSTPVTMVVMDSVDGWSTDDCAH